MSFEKLDLNNQIILVTGAAGFIGSNLVKRLFKDVPQSHIIGVDNLNDYYDVSLKEYRLEELKKLASDGQWTFICGTITDQTLVMSLFREIHPSIVVNLAAQAGVRYSIDHPDTYIDTNIVGFYNILEACRHSYDGNKKGVKHLIYASSSSVYGGNKKLPFATEDRVDSPISLYAATKKADELLAHAYAKLYNIPSTGLRFFTVYGPAGRPDMFYFSATKKLVAGQIIEIFNYGNCKRDFTYIDDVIEGVMRVIKNAPKRINGEDGLPKPPHRIYNIGGSTPENLLDFIATLQEELVRAGVLPIDYNFEAHRKLVPMQPGDMTITYADCQTLERDFGFRPNIRIREGLRKFAEWYKKYYG